MRLLFDHGTLVLAETPDLRLDFVPGLLWDPRVELFRAPAFRYAEARAALRSRGFAYTDEVPARHAPEPATWRDVPLRPYQRAAVLAWELAEQRGLLVMPTGSGKTRAALGAIAGSGGRTLCLVPTRALLQQWLTQLSAAYTGPVGCLGDGQRAVEAVTVSTFESAYRLMPTIGNRFDLLVVDEAHHFGVGVRDEALEMCTATRRLGLTATPPDAAALHRLSSLLGDVVYQIGVDDLTGSYLAEFDLVVVPLGLNEAERTRYDADNRVFSELNRRFRQLHPHGTWKELLSVASQSA
ncbi:MAG TPA: DEAD/DEAH box helicase family protein, partial [Polyangiaceae bacterium]|nr:DEAD/DEAH box helicase family protein [Polyangiaceae bacterium]